MRYIKKLVIIMFCGALVACQGSVTSKEARRNSATGKVDIVRHYDLLYSEDLGEVFFNAKFKEGRGWLAADVILEEPAFIRLDGQQLSGDIRRDEFDAGEIASFYGGFVFPVFWLFLGDNGRAKYSTKAPLRSGDYIIDFGDPEGEIHTDTIKIPQATFSIPDRIDFETQSLRVSASAQGFDDTTCTLVYEANETEVITRILENGTEEEVEQTTRVHRMESLTPGRQENLDTVIAESLEDTVQVSCVASTKKNLYGGSGGDLTVSYQGETQDVQIR